MFGVVAGSRFLSVDLELPVPLPLPPARCQTPGVSVSAGGRGGRERALPYYFLPQVLFHSRARALTLSEVYLHPPGLVSAIVAVLLTHGK